MAVCEEALLRDLVHRAMGQRVPLTGTLALTYRCNLKCAHCFAQPAAARSKELSTAQWLDILGQAVDAGLLFAVVTGGEPLIRSDFAEIYRFLCEHGVRVTVFTNATHVTEEIVELFCDLPPRRVEASIYGATEATSRRVTGVENALSRAVDGLTRMRDAGVRVNAKTVLLTLNRHEFEQLLPLWTIAKQQSTVTPRDADKSPTKF